MSFVLFGLLFFLFCNYITLATPILHTPFILFISRFLRFANKIRSFSSADLQLHHLFCLLLKLFALFHSISFCAICLFLLVSRYLHMPRGSYLRVFCDFCVQKMTFCSVCSLSYLWLLTNFWLFWSPGFYLFLFSLIFLLFVYHMDIFVSVIVFLPAAISFLASFYLLFYLLLGLTASY